MEGKAFFAASGGKADAARYEGLYFDASLRRKQPRSEERQREASEASDSRLPADGVLAKELVERARRGRAQIIAVDAKDTSLQPPQNLGSFRLKRAS